MFLGAASPLVGIAKDWPPAVKVIAGASIAVAVYLVRRAVRRGLLGALFSSTGRDGQKR